MNSPKRIAFADPPYPGRWWWVEITEPEHLQGRMVVPVDAEMCLEANGFGVCGLVRNHRGDHWLCSRDFAEQAGPWAIVKP